MNIVMISGNLTDDPKEKQSSTGVKVATVSVAARRERGGRDNVDYIDCIAFSGTADYVLSWARKGSFVEVFGRWEARKYDRKDGTKGVEHKLSANSVYVMNGALRDAFQEEAETSFSGRSTADEVTEDDLPF